MTARFFLLVVAAALALTTCHCHDPVEPPPRSLSTSSRWIVDERGRRVKLACVNWPSHLEPVLAEGLSHRPLAAIAAGVAAMGFNCVRLTWPTFLVAGDATYSALTVAESLRRLNLTSALAGVEAHNAGLLGMALADAFRAVVRGLGDAGVMVILDNHVSRPGWCCRAGDGDGFFGDADFDPDVWVEGLRTMAAMFAGEENVVGMSLRNELRGPRQNTNDWYRYMQRGAEAVHAANPRVLVILSGLRNDNDLAFLNRRPVHLTFSNKLAFEVHWYSFSDPHQWLSGNPNAVCARVAASVARRTLYLLGRGWPVFLSEFGVDNRGGNAADERYWGCAAAAIAGLDLDWGALGAAGELLPPGGRGRARRGLRGARPRLAPATQRHGAPQGPCPAAPAPGTRPGRGGAVQRPVPPGDGALRAAAAADGGAGPVRGDGGVGVQRGA
ncbi:unnamed protein product [Urochloa decumbens]|uniref:Glycoside hydrolase family 5 domain-containing protein n=1 Tax=Urochloa decumbens TaxID=240449 RepID=A0ABC9CYI8_9POAL